MNHYMDWSILQVVGAIVDYESQVVLASLFDMNFGKGFVGAVLNIDIENVVLS